MFMYRSFKDLLCVLGKINKYSVGGFFYIIFKNLKFQLSLTICHNAFCLEVMFWENQFKLNNMLVIGYIKKLIQKLESKPQFS